MNATSINDTICAISTPAGIGGIAVIRVSGANAIEIVNSLWKGCDLSKSASHTTHLGELTAPERSEETIDRCVATIFRAPHSYTGENTVEISVHGSRWIQREAISALQRAGCRIAEAGEYTRRAVINGRMDISQAEAVADVIASTSRAAHRIAMSQMKGSISRKLQLLREQLVQLSALLELELDFSEEDVEFADRSHLLSIAQDIRTEIQRLHNSFRNGSAIKKGIPVAIIGATNAGKSSLLNTLLDDDRAIVSDIHGTTRDTIEETIEIGDYTYRFIDTAGLRDTSDPIEQIGIRRSMEAIAKARIIIALIDIATLHDLSVEELTRQLPIEIKSAISTDDCEYVPYLIIGLNKIDTANQETQNYIDTLCNNFKPISEHREASTSINLNAIIPFSAKTGLGIDRLRHAIQCAIQTDDTKTDDIIITNLRQAEALRQALESTTALITGLKNGLETDLVAQHMRETISHLSAVTGEIPSSEILNTIFKSFCVGK